MHSLAFKCSCCPDILTPDHDPFDFVSLKKKRTTFKIFWSGISMKVPFLYYEYVYLYISSHDM